MYYRGWYGVDSSRFSCRLFRRSIDVDGTGIIDSIDERSKFLLLAGGYRVLILG